MHEPTPTDVAVSRLALSGVAAVIVACTVMSYIGMSLRYSVIYQNTTGHS